MQPPGRRRAAAAAVACALAASALVIAPRPARAQVAAGAANDAPLVLAWEAPAPSCPDRDHALGEIARLLGRAPVTARALRVHVRIAPGPTGGWQMRLESTTREGATGERTLEGATCAQLADATALVVAMLVDPAAVAARADRPGASAPAPQTSAARAPTSAARAPASAPPAPPTMTPRPRSAPARARPASPGATTLAVRLAAVGDVGTLPGVAIGLGAALVVMAGPARLELTATAFAPQAAPALLAGNRGVADAFLVEAGVRGCWAARWRLLELGPCAALEAGYAHARATGISAPRPGGDGGPWVAVFAGGGAAVYPVRWLALRAGLELGATAVAPAFGFTGAYGGQPDAAVALVTASPVVGRGSLGVEVHFR